MVIPYHRFKELAALYRDKHKEEITLYALKFTYLNLLQGVKTALAQKLEPKTQKAAQKRNVRSG